MTETTRRDKPEKTAEREAKFCYETWIKVIDANPKPWEKLSPEQKAIWLRLQPQNNMT